MNRPVFSDIPLTAARWFFLINVVVAAWLYGGTREWTRTTISFLLIANTILFLVGLAARRRWPRLPGTVAVGVFVLLIQAWFLTWNSKSRFIEAAQVFIRREQPLPSWPGFMDTALVLPSVLLATGILGAFCISCDLASNRIWRDRVWVTLAATGLSLVVLGLAQRLTNAPSIFWDLDSNLGETFFSVFRYHANAGAFINLVLPLMAALAAKNWMIVGNEKARVFWTLATLLTAAAGFVNVSRAANVICAVLLIGMGISLSLLAMKSFKRFGNLAGVGLALTLTTLVVILAFSFGLEKTQSRWELGFWKTTFQEDGRYQAYQVIASSALPEAGPWGFGPGTFEKMFEIHRNKSGSAVAGRWDKAHSDALQTPMEWGWLGAGVWFALLFCAIVRAVSCAIQKNLGEGRILAAGCAFSLLGIVVHALVDFPFQIPSLGLYAMTIAGLAWGMNPRGARDEKNKMHVRSERAKM